MSKLEFFMKRNRIERNNIFVPASSAFKDEKGKTIMWELRPLKSSEVSAINRKATKEKKLANGQVERVIDGSKVTEMLIAKSVVFPDLENAELQDSYNVKTPIELVHELIEDPGEYNALALKIQEINHLGITLESKVKEAKN